MDNHAETIETTLRLLGAPGKVVSVKIGPRLTQYGVIPGIITRGGKQYRVKAATIARLETDLSLALARPVRIQTPVALQHYVGIEIPNDAQTAVRLGHVTHAPVYKSIASPLRIALGIQTDGTPLAFDLASAPHLLVAGTTGSGKSVFLNSVICNLLINNTPDALKLFMIDPKRVELAAYNGIRHLMTPVETDMPTAAKMLAGICDGMDGRYSILETFGCRNIEQYNRLRPTPMPRIVVIIDELADLLTQAPESGEHLIRLAQLARAVGIHLVTATQRPSVDVVKGLLKANFPTRAAFSVATSADSRTVLGHAGAEKLLGRGDMLFTSPTTGLKRLQGVEVTEAEQTMIINHWRKKYAH